MLRFIIHRLIAMVLTIWAVSFVAFAIIQLPPGDYLTTYMATLSANGDRVDPAAIEALRQQYGFGESYLVQYWKWISGIVLRGDFGQSFEWKAPVTTLIWGRLGNSILLEGIAVIVMWLVALPIGIYVAVRKYSLGDYLVTVLGFLGLAIPNFFFALILMYLSFVWFGETIGGLFSPQFEAARWSLPRFWDFLTHAWLPVMVLALAGTAELIRILRANLLDELKKPYVTTARAKGLSEVRTILKYPVRVANNAARSR
jgi:peptide/nickel transport system permease protein